MLPRAPATISALFFLSSTFAYAGLGGSLDSVHRDAKRFGGHYKVTQLSHCQRHEFSSQQSQIHEFLNPNGSVFAVAWHGRKHPDLRVLLGDHFNDFEDALGQARREHRRAGAIMIDRGNLHLEIGGHTMAVYGKAWIKDQVPEGMDLSVLR